MKHPFHGGVKKRGITQRHRPLIWENMLGTVMARSPEGVVTYFDYDWDAARAHAQVDGHTDLRIAPCKTSYQGWPAQGRYALWGIPRG